MAAQVDFADARRRDHRCANAAGTVCKHILDDLGVEYASGIDVPVCTASAHLNLAPHQHSQEVFKKILGGCAAVVTSLSEVRNKLSDAHGKDRVAARPAPRHAELAVNLAGSMAAFWSRPGQQVTFLDAPPGPNTLFARLFRVCIGSGRSHQ